MMCNRDIRNAIFELSSQEGGGGQILWLFHQLIISTGKEQNSHANSRFSAVIFD